MAESNQRNTEELRSEEAWNGSSASSESATQDEGSDDTLERAEVIAAGAESRDDMNEDDLDEQLDELAASTEEEVEALRINLLQEDERPRSRDGSGLIVDEVAEERVARFTEADPRQTNLGAVSVEPGQDNTSEVLRRHHSKVEITRSDAVLEGNLDEPMDELVGEPKAGERTGS